MKRYCITACVLTLTAALAYGQDDKPPAEPKPPKPETPAAESKPQPAPAEQKPVAAAEGELSSLRSQASYGVGLNIGGSLLQQGFRAEELDIDLEAFTQGIKDALSRQKPRLSEEQLKNAMKQFQEQATAKQEELAGERKQSGEKNKKAGEEFLAENAKKEGVKTTESGLQYQVLKEGDGPKPKATDTVKVHYQGTLINGEEFDSSYKRGEPISFPLNRVIPGWTEGVQLMNVGSKYKLFIPYELGYGPDGSPPKIPPYSVLVFDIELLGIGEEEPTEPPTP